jgi:hypothetical protein
MLGIELVEELDEEPLAAAVLKLGANGDIDLGGKSLAFPLELFDQIFI